MAPEDWHVLLSCVMLLATFAMTINSLYLRSMAKKFTEFEKRLSSKQDKEICKQLQYSCKELREEKEKSTCRGVDDIWEALGKHGHEGLPPGAKITR